MITLGVTTLFRIQTITYQSEGEEWSVHDQETILLAFEKAYIWKKPDSIFDIASIKGYRLFYYDSSKKGFSSR